jgi:hypothetical protein
LSGNGRNFAGNSSFIDSVNGIRSGATWSCSSSLVGNILNTDYHSIFFSIRFNSTATFSQAWTGSWNKIFEHTGSSGDRSPGIWRFPNNRTIHWRYNPSNSGADFGPTSSSGYFPINSWFIVGVTKNGGTARSYVNGNEVASSSVSFPKQTGSGTDLYKYFREGPVEKLQVAIIYNIQQSTLSTRNPTRTIMLSSPVTSKYSKKL